MAPLLDSPEAGVRIAALRAIITLDPDTAASYLAKAAHDAEPSVRRRAALLAVTLGPERTLELEREAAPRSRSRGAPPGGAGRWRARGRCRQGRLTASLDDDDLGVRRAAARKPLPAAGVELGHVPELSDEERRREIRRIATLQPPPLAVRARFDEPLPEPIVVAERARPVESVGEEMEEAGPPPELHSDEALCLQISRELQGQWWPDGGRSGRTAGSHRRAGGRGGGPSRGTRSGGAARDEAVRSPEHEERPWSYLLTTRKTISEAPGSADQGHPGGAGSGQLFRRRSLEAPQDAAAVSRPLGNRKQLFLNFKGGRGKTSLSTSYAYRLAELGYSVLLVDLDSQGHATKCLGCRVRTSRRRCSTCWSASAAGRRRSSTRRCPTSTSSPATWG